MRQTLRRLQQTSATKLLIPANEQAMGAFRQQVWKALLGSGRLLDQRTQALQDARSSLAEARRAGDASTDLEADGSLDKRRGDALAPRTRDLGDDRDQPLIQGITPPQNPLGDGLTPLQQALAPLAEITPAAVLKQAAALARARPTDPVAIAWRPT